MIKQKDTEKLFVLKNNPEMVNEFSDEYYRVIYEGQGFRVKRLRILPEGRVIYQTHARGSSSEHHWLIVSGEGKITLDGQEKVVRTGETIDISIGETYRIENTVNEKLIFIEIQIGDFCGKNIKDQLSNEMEPNSNGTASKESRSPRGKGIWL